MPENKLQIRAKLLSAIADLQVCNKENINVIAKIVASLRFIEDKNAVLEVLLKELSKDTNEQKTIIISFLIKELIDKEEIEKTVVKELVNPKLNDNIKTKLVNILRTIGHHVDYEEFSTYFENPDEIINADTTTLLNNAIVNPAAQIDFLDFINALPQNEQEMLIASLNEDYDGDNIANILTPVILSKPYSQLAFQAIRYIGESKSQLALSALNSVLEITDDAKICAQVQKSLSLLKLGGIKEDNTERFYKKMLADFPIFRCFASLPDGHGNIGIIVSRKTSNDLIQMFSIVLNDYDGIIESFGFSEITVNEFNRIVTKFYSNGPIIPVPPEFCKFITENAEKLTRLKYDEISYEYIAWKTLLKDVDYEEINYCDYIEKTQLTDLSLKQLYKKEYFSNWFFETSDNDDFASLIKELKPEDILNCIDNLYDKVFTSEFLKVIDNRLKLTAYLLMFADQKEDAETICSLTDDTQYKKEFLSDILKKSIYEYFLNEREKYKNIKNSQSIFTKKRTDIEQIDIKYVENCINEIEKHWVEHE